MCYTQEICDALPQQLPKDWHRERYISYQVKRRAQYYVPIVVVAFSWNNVRYYKSFHVKSSGGIVKAFIEARLYRNELLKELKRISPRRYKNLGTTGCFVRRKRSRKTKEFA